MLLLLAQKHVTIVLCICVTLIYSDANLLAPNLTACALDLGLNEQERDSKLGGGIAVGLFLVGAPAALFIGVVADGDGAHMSKAALMGWVLFIGGMGCLGSAMSQTYAQLFVSRALTGVSLAGGMPLTYALTTEYYGPEIRTKISGRIGVCSSAGVIFGQSLSGWIGPTWGWRSPFWVVGIAILVGSILVWTVIVPSSTAVAKSGDRKDDIKKKFDLKQWSSVLTNKTYWLLLLQGIPGCVPWSVFSTFLPDYLHVNIGYRVEEATLIMLVFKAGTISGTLVGGEVGQWLYNQSPTYPPVFMFVLGCIRIFPILFLFYDTPTDLWTCCLLGYVAGCLASPTGILARATLSNVTTPGQQGVAYATFVLTDDIGKGGGPVLVSYLIRKYGRRSAFGYAMLLWLPNAFLLGLTALTVEVDERNVEIASKGTNKKNEEEGGEHYEMASLLETM
jgi:predicted MFS family arabinose efflux permease